MYTLTALAISFTMMFSGVNLPVRQDAETASVAEDCPHGVETAEYAERVTGGYTHTFINSKGEIAACSVTEIEEGYYRKCPVCNVIKGYMRTGIRGLHSNPGHV